MHLFGVDEDSYQSSLRLSHHPPDEKLVQKFKAFGRRSVWLCCRIDGSSAPSFPLEQEQGVAGGNEDSLPHALLSRAVARANRRNEEGGSPQVAHAAHCRRLSQAGFLLSFSFPSCPSHDRLFSHRADVVDSLLPQSARVLVPLAGCHAPGDWVVVHEAGTVGVNASRHSPD